MYYPTLDEIKQLRLFEVAAPIEGVQFHPESIMTPSGKDLLRNYLTNKGEAQLVASLQKERHH